MDNGPVSRRAVLQGGAAAAVAGGAAAAAVSSPAILSGAMTGRSYRAYARFGADGGRLIDVRMLPLDPDRVVVRTEATQACYTILGQVAMFPNAPKPPALNPQSDPQSAPEIIGHGGVGIVEAVGSRVRRVQVGDRVIVANTPQCGVCYACLRGRPDRCQMGPAAGQGGPGYSKQTPVAEMADGTRVVQHDNIAGFSELMIPYEWYCVPVFHDVSPVELSMLGCVGACGLGTAFGVAPIEPASDVCVIGCGPVGLSAIQGARIKGASQIIGVEPIAYRRELALKLGATTVFDPNAEGDELLKKIRRLCGGPGERKLAGGRDRDSEHVSTGAYFSDGPDYVIEAVGGDVSVPKAGAGPDPTGVLPLQQAWQLCNSTGHVCTISVGQTGTIGIPARDWSNGAKNHHPGNMNGVSTLRDMQRFARLIETGQFNAKALATATFPLDRIREAFQQVADRTTVGAVITFG
jgi:S-(hydroxymethyl)glutathione dehydrogenase/alcohol dehydrogenase